MPSRTAISALFLDFDGTISPVDVPREKAYPTLTVRKVLQKIAETIPVAVITTKDMQFIKERVPFASAWAAIGGVEVKIGNRTLTLPRAISSSPMVESALERVEAEVRKIDEGIYIERKALSDGRVVAFCVDWRRARDWNTVRRQVDALFRPFEERGLIVRRYNGRPYLDVYPEGVSKGHAFLNLKEELRIDGPIMYLGDSELDNPAFELAEVSIGVLHNETSPKLDSEFFVRFNHVGALFHELLKNRLVFNSESRWIVRNELRETE